LLLQKGYDPEHFFSQVLFAGGHDKVVIAVYNGQVDGGATFDDARTLVTTTLPDVMDRVKVIAYTEPIPNDLVSVRPGLPAEMVEKLQTALLDIAGTDEGRKVLKALYGIDGLEPTTDAAYDPVRHAAEFLNLDLEAEVAGKPK
jgi:phosphonate transport system substrate-binding protein